MNAQRFEQEILRLAFETNTPITPASVAYYLGVPTRESKRLLDQLLEDGVLELESDGSGNLFYIVPHQETISENLRQHREHVATPMPEPTIPSGVQFVSANDEESAPISPRANRPPEAQNSGQDAAIGQHTQQAPPMGPVLGGWGASPDEPTGGTHAAALGHAVERIHPAQPSPPSGVGRPGVFQGVTNQGMAETDAWVGQFSSPVVVADSVRCEPKPLSDSRPTIVSCVDPEEERTHAMNMQSANVEQEWFNQQMQPQPGAMVLANAHGGLPMPLDYIEQPEHQPGMALLLSLILCGTGQIYNGEVSKGIMMMVLCFLLWFVLLGWVVHIWSIVDAVVVAERINRKQHA